MEEKKDKLQEWVEEVRRTGTTKTIVISKEKFENSMEYIKTSIYNGTCTDTTTREDDESLSKKIKTNHDQKQAEELVQCTSTQIMIHDHNNGLNNLNNDGGHVQSTRTNTEGDPGILISFIYIGNYKRGEGERKWKMIRTGTGTPEMEQEIPRERNNIQDMDFKEWKPILFQQLMKYKYFVHHEFQTNREYEHMIQFIKKD